MKKISVLVTTSYLFLGCSSNAKKNDDNKSFDHTKNFEE